MVVNTAESIILTLGPLASFVFGGIFFPAYLPARGFYQPAGWHEPNSIGRDSGGREYSSPDRFARLRENKGVVRFILSDDDEPLRTGAGIINRYCNTSSRFNTRNARDG